MNTIRGAEGSANNEVVVERRGGIPASTVAQAVRDYRNDKDAEGLALRQFLDKGNRDDKELFLCTTDTVRSLIFTDIVGSSNIFNLHGDEFGYEILNIHNEIVRAKLDRYEGVEVKHTGDGILASFESCGRAVKASLNIIQSVKDHSAEFPLVGFSVRIGVNIGNILIGDDDIYGASVNLAARLCNLANDADVLCTGIVRARCETKGYQFVDGGDTEVKGFEDRIPVHHARIE